MAPAEMLVNRDGRSSYVEWQLVIIGCPAAARTDGLANGSAHGTAQAETGRARVLAQAALLGRPVIGGTLSLNALEQVSNASVETSATPPPR